MESWLKWRWHGGQRVTLDSLCNVCHWSPFFRLLGNNPKKTLVVIDTLKGTHGGQSRISWMWQMGVFWCQVIVELIPKSPLWQLPHQSVALEFLQPISFFSSIQTVIVTLGGSLVPALNPIKVFGINTIGFWFWTLGVIILDGCYNATSVAWQYFQGFLLFWNLTFLHWWWPHKGRWHVPLHTGASPPPTVIDLLRTSLLPPLCAPPL